MGKTNIEWCDFSINPIRARLKSTGAVGHYCEKVAQGCTNCYSSNFQKRFGLPAFGSGQHRDKFEIFLDESKLAQVVRRKKPTKWFWCDMTDFFGDWMESEWLRKCFETMDATPHHTHMLLTKRTENILRMWSGGTGWYRKNVWLGTSVSEQKTADENIDELIQCRNLCPVLFVSYEPALGPVDFGLPLIRHGDGLIEKTSALDWIIVGGESGHGARTGHIDWYRSAIRQCNEAGVSVFMKQTGAAYFEDSKSGQRTKYMPIKSSKGGDMSEWPEDIRVREFPLANQKELPL